MGEILEGGVKVGVGVTKSVRTCAFAMVYLIREGLVKVSESAKKLKK